MCVLWFCTEMQNDWKSESNITCSPNNRWGGKFLCVCACVCLDAWSKMPGTQLISNKLSACSLSHLPSPFTFGCVMSWARFHKVMHVIVLCLLLESASASCLFCVFLSPFLLSLFRCSHSLLIVTEITNENSACAERRNDMFSLLNPLRVVTGFRLGFSSLLKILTIWENVFTVHSWVSRWISLSPEHGDQSQTWRAPSGHNKLGWIQTEI